MPIRDLEDRLLEGLDKITSGWTAWRRRRALPRPKQAKVLKAMSRPLSVGRSMVEVANYFAEHGYGAQRDLGLAIKQAKQSGMPASDAFGLWLDPVSTSALRSAESGGARTLARAMRLLADDMQRESEGLSKVFKLWLHPGLYVVFSTVLLVIMGVKVAPIVASLQDTEQVTMLMRAVEFYTGEFWLWLFLLGGLGAGYVYYLHHGIGDLRVQLDNAGLTAAYQRKVGASILRSFALLKQIGVPAHRIFKNLSQTGSRYYRWHLHRMRDRLSEGQAQDVIALDTGLYDAEQMALIRLYASSDSRDELAEALMEAADDINERSIEKLRLAGLTGAALLWIWLFYNIIVLITFIFSVNA